MQARDARPIGRAGTTSQRGVRSAGCDDEGRRDAAIRFRSDVGARQIAVSPTRRCERPASGSGIFPPRGKLPGS